jgi:hypothetical protein
MPQAIRIWQIVDNAPRELKLATLDLEARLEAWLEQDIGMLGPDLLVIGKQVETDFGGIIDLLALNPNGDVVIIELKRDRTPREITAQVLDYASWVSDLDGQRIGEIAARYLGSRGPLEAAFTGKFRIELPETLNQAHRVLVVGASVDPASERIIRYLSNTYGVDINAATFQYFRDQHGHELLGRVFLIEPAEVTQKAATRGAGKRRPNLTQEELRALAVEGRVEAEYDAVLRILRPHFDGIRTTRSGLNLVGTLGDGRGTIINLLPGESSPDRGIRFQLYAARLAEHAGVPVAAVAGALPPNAEGWSFDPRSDPGLSDFTGFLSVEDAQRLVEQVFQAAERKQPTTVPGGEETS